MKRLGFRGKMNCPRFRASKWRSQCWNHYLLCVAKFWLKWSESCSGVSDSLPPCGLYSPWNTPGQNTGVGSPCFLQGIFPTQGLNLRPCVSCIGRQIPYHLSHRDAPYKTVHRLLYHLCKNKQQMNRQICYIILHQKISFGINKKLLTMLTFEQ